MESRTNPWQNVLVKTIHGDDVKLATRWSNNVTVLYLVRRFGCAYCQNQGSILMELKTALQKTGVFCTFVAVGGGTKHVAEKFRLGTMWEGEVYLDAPHATFKAMGLQRFTVWQNMKRFYLSHRALQYSKPLYERFTQSDFVGDAMQSGGVFILGPGLDSTVKYRFIEAEKTADETVDVFDMYKIITGQDLNADEFKQIHTDCVKAHAQAMAALRRRGSQQQLQQQQNIKSGGTQGGAGGGTTTATSASGGEVTYSPIPATLSPHDHTHGGNGGGGVPAALSPHDHTHGGNAIGRGGGGDQQEQQSAGTTSTPTFSKQQQEREAGMMKEKEISAATTTTSGGVITMDTKETKEQQQQQQADNSGTSNVPPNRSNNYHDDNYDDNEEDEQLASLMTDKARVGGDVRGGGPFGEPATTSSTYMPSRRLNINNNNNEKTEEETPMVHKVQSVDLIV